MKKIRDYESVKSRIMRQMQKVEMCFEKYATYQMNQEGGHQYEDVKLSYLDWPQLVIDEFLPWELVDLGNGHKLRRLPVPSIGVRDNFFAGASDVIYAIGNATQNPRKAVEMSLIASYFNGFHRFYYLGKKEFTAIMSDDHPAIKFHQIYEKEFRNESIADCHSGNRINPCGVAFKNVFYSDCDPERKTLTMVVDGIIGILEWINLNIDDDNEFNHAGIERKFRQCLDDFKNNTRSKLDFSEFRLMMAVQMCCLSGIVVKGHKNLNNLVYPVKTSGAAKQLKHLDNDERQAMQMRIL